MNRPAIATVLSARPWEARLCEAVHRTALVRLVGRVYEPIELRRRQGLDWVVVGSETSWLTPAAIEAIRRRGVGVVGVHPDDDAPAAALLRAAGADLVVAESVESVDLLRRLGTPPSRQPSGGHVVAVVGPRGAGVTTVAIALAHGQDDTALIDTDEVPGIGPALGLPPPEPGGWVLGEHRVGATRLGQEGPTVVTLGSVEGPLSVGLGVEIVRAAATTFGLVVVDAPPPFSHRLGWWADEVVLVLDAGVQGLLRGMAVVAEWSWPTPRLVLNRVTADDAVQAARSTIGLEPVAAIPQSNHPIATASSILAGMLSVPVG